MESLKGYKKTTLEILMDRSDWGIVMIPGHYPEKFRTLNR